MVASHPYLSLPNNITYYHVVNTNIKRLTTYVWNRIVAESRRTDTYIASCDVLPIIIGDHLKRRHNTTSLPLFLPMSGQPHHSKSGRPQGIAPTIKINSTNVFSDNYALRIMHYELIITRTSVRLYENSQMCGLSQQSRIMHYELRIHNITICLLPLKSERLV